MLEKAPKGAANKISLIQNNLMLQVKKLKIQNEEFTY